MNSILVIGIGKFGHHFAEKLIALGNVIDAQYMGYNEVLPTDETEKAIREIGAIINDIQKLGDYGIAKWKTE